MKNLSLLLKGNISGTCAYILWLVLFFVFAGFAQAQARAKRPEKPETKSTTLKFYRNEGHRGNFRTLKKYLGTLKPEKGDIRKYIVALDSVMEIISKASIDSTRYNEWLQKAINGFSGLDSISQIRICAFAASLPLVPLTLEDLDSLQFFAGSVRDPLGPGCCGPWGCRFPCCEFPCLDHLFPICPPHWGRPQGKE